MYIISACLAGENCKYDGSNTKNDELAKLVDEGKAIAVCPEVLGNLSVPREPCEIVNNRVMTKSGKDLTTAFLKGACKTLELCLCNGIKKAILQPRSPSCGYGHIYDGSFSRNMIPGNGITADLLSKNGIEVFTPENWKH